MTNKLIEKALQKPTSKNSTSITKDECELAIGVLKGEVTLPQYAYATDKKTGTASIAYRVYIVLQRSLSQGWIEIKMK